MYTFEEIAGNELIKKNLQNAILRETASHAYILDGDAGMGKTLIVRTIAKTMQCESEGTTPCCVCVSCRIFDSLNHPDIVYVAPASRKSIGVDDIREQVSRSIETRPYKYKYKIFIIENACTMTPAAQNALLKTIEEPVGYGVFLLTSENIMSFLPTVLSRCVVLKLKPLADSVVIKYLQDLGFSEKDVQEISAYSRGNIGKALKLKDDEQFYQIKELVFKTVAKDGNHIAVDAFKAAGEYDSFKESIQDVLDMLYIWYRDVLVYKSTGEIRFLIEKGSVIHIKKAAARLSEKSILNKLNAIFESGVKLKYNANFGMTINMLMMELKS